MSQFPSSGPLSMSTIATDLGVATNVPYSMNNFRNKTLYNLNGTTYQTPSTGELSIQYFYGRYYTNPLPDKYIFINNLAEETAAAAGYSSSLFTGYILLDIVLVSGGGAGGWGGSGAQLRTGAGGGSGYRVGYIPATYTDPATNYIYNYTIATGTPFQINLTSYSFDTIKVTLGIGGISTIPTLTPSGSTVIELINGGNIIFTNTSAPVPSIDGFNGGGARSANTVVGTPGTGVTSEGGENGTGVIGGGIGAGTTTGYPEPGSGAGGSGVQITLNTNTILTGGSFPGPIYNGLDYTGGGAAGGQDDGTGGNGGKGYAILWFHN